MPIPTAGAHSKSLYDGLQVVAEGAGTADKIFYTHSDAPVGGIVCRDANGTKYWYHYDHIGNVVAVTDANGDPVVSYAMEAFGGVVAVGSGGGFYYSASEVQPYHLTTKEWDSDVGLYYFNARWYDPATGRFVSRSTLEKPYVFCDSNPASRIDPNGELSRQITINVHIRPWPSTGVLAAVACGGPAAVAWAFGAAQDLPGWVDSGGEDVCYMICRAAMGCGIGLGVFGWNKGFPIMKDPFTNLPGIIGIPVGGGVAMAPCCEALCNSAPPKRSPRPSWVNGCSNDCAPLLGTPSFPGCWRACTAMGWYY